MRFFILVVGLLGYVSSCYGFKASIFSSQSLIHDRFSMLMKAKKTLSEIPKHHLKGKRVLVRCDFNCPLDGKKITDDSRIRASLPTLTYLLNAGATVAACSHLGRPKGKEDKFSLEPCATRVAQLCPTVNVKFANDCIGSDVMDKCKEGHLVILENVRFYKEEEQNDNEFAKKLAEPFDMFVNDAFGSAHRAHSSTAGITKYLKPCVAGFLMSQELKYLDTALKHGERPLAAIVGGSKVSTKINILNSLIEKCDKLIIGGAMMFTFLAAKGLKTGNSLVEKEFIETANEIMNTAEEKGCELVLPDDVHVADSFSNDAKSLMVNVRDIPDGWMGLDIGKLSRLNVIKKLENCKTIIWNGPIGVFEFDNFARGSVEVAKTLADLTANKGVTTVVGGGDSVALLKKFGYSDQISHVSTGGGAALELLEGKVLPGVAALDDFDEGI